MTGPDLETTGTGDDANRIGQAPPAQGKDDPERSSRQTATPAPDEGARSSESIEPHNEGLA